MNFFKILTSYNLVILTSLLSACVPVQNNQPIVEVCPKPKFKFVSEHHLKNFDGCRNGETFSSSDGMNFECKETIDVENYNGKIVLLRKFDDHLKCGEIAKGTRKLLRESCQRGDFFKWGIKKGFPQLKSYALPAEFVGGIQMYSIEHRIVLVLENKVSYKVFLDNDSYIPFTLCEMMDANGKRFWFRQL